MLFIQILFAQVVAILYNHTAGTPQNGIYGVMTRQLDYVTVNRVFGHLESIHQLLTCSRTNSTKIH